MPKNAMESADQIMIHVNAEITPKAFMPDLSIILEICGAPIYGVLHHARLPLGLA
jgi:hypothetical protein